MTETPYVTHNPPANRFETTVGGLTAVLTYRRAGDLIFLEHTGVPPELEGRGIGSALVAAAVREAQHESLTVVPLCSFVRHWLDKHPEEQMAVEWPPKGS